MRTGIIVSQTPTPGLVTCNHSLVSSRRQTRVQIIRAAGNMGMILEVRGSEHWYLKPEHKLCPNPWLTITLTCTQDTPGSSSKRQAKLEDSLHSLEDSAAPRRRCVNFLCLGWVQHPPHAFQAAKGRKLSDFRCQREELRAEGVTGNLEPHSKGIRERGWNPKILV